MEFKLGKEELALKEQQLFQTKKIEEKEIEIDSENNIEEKDTKDIEISRWCLELPDRVESLILSYLVDPDVLGILGQVSKHGFVLNDYNKEDAYKAVAKDIFQNVTLSKFKSFHDVIKNRARVRTNGFYTLQLRYHRRPSNDAFWEDKRYEDIIVNFYRHFRFLKNGRCLYALEVKPPYEIQALLDKGEPIHKTIFEGFYLMDKGYVVVLVNLRYTVMRFRLQIIEEVEEDDEYRALGLANLGNVDATCYTDDDRQGPRGGKFTRLKIVEHCSLGKFADQLLNQLFIDPEKVKSNPTSPTRNDSSNTTLHQESVEGERENDNENEGDDNQHQDQRLAQVLSLSAASAHYFEIPPSADLRYIRQWWWK